MILECSEIFAKKKIFYCEAFEKNPTVFVIFVIFILKPKKISVLGNFIATFVCK